MKLLFNRLVKNLSLTKEVQWNPSSMGHVHKHDITFMRGGMYEIYIEKSLRFSWHTAIKSGERRLGSLKEHYTAKVIDKEQPMNDHLEKRSMDKKYILLHEEIFKELSGKRQYKIVR